MRTERYAPFTFQTSISAFCGTAYCDWSGKRLSLRSNENRNEEISEIMTQLDKFRYRIPLALVVYAIYYLLVFIINGCSFRSYFADYGTAKDYMLEFTVTLLSCFFFVEISVLYSRLLSRIFPVSGHTYRSIILEGIALIILNIITAYLFNTILIILDPGCEAYFSQSFYTICILVTFISSIYINARYMDMMTEAESSRRVLEVNLAKEKEMQAKAQLETLKAQIDPHFMFNNFSILSELIVEDPPVAEQFLENLSKVYRYVIRAPKKDLISIREELTFLDSYIYLIKTRYDGQVNVNVSSEVASMPGMIPPASLQILVENAIRHNRLSVEEPLEVNIFRNGNDIIVENPLRPLKSEMESTGTGLQNISDRYMILCGHRPAIMDGPDSYIVRIPVICTDYMSGTTEQKYFE